MLNTNKVKVQHKCESCSNCSEEEFEYSFLPVIFSVDFVRKDLVFEFCMNCKKMMNIVIVPSDAKKKMQDVIKSCSERFDLRHLLDCKMSD